MLPQVAGIGSTSQRTLGVSLDTPMASITHMPGLDLSLSALARPSVQGDAIVVGSSTPPVPRKLAERVWRIEFVGMEEFLPAKLGAAEPSILDALTEKHKKQSEKKIECIEQWVCSFNTYTTIMAMKHPEKVGDLLAYSSLIVQNSRAYEGKLWLGMIVTFGVRGQLSVEACWQMWTRQFGHSTSERRFPKGCVEIALSQVICPASKIQVGSLHKRER